VKLGLSPRALWVGAILWLSICTPAAGQLASKAYEVPPVVRAADILPSRMLSSGHYRVRDRVSVEGELYGFRIESDYGLYEVQSLAMLEIRLHELATLAQAISQFRVRDNAFAERLRGQLSVGAYSIVDVVKAPFSMATQLAGNIERTAEELRELPRGVTSEARANPYVDTVASDPVTGAHKRNVAYQLGLNVYSTNPRVQAFLNTVAKERSAGHFAAGVATIRVAPSRSVRIAGGRLEAEARNLLKNLTPDELDAGVDDQLRRFGVPASVRSAFVHHGYYSPSHKTVITAYLDYLRGVRSRPTFIKAALRAGSEAQAVAFENLARMLAHYHETIEPLAELGAFEDQPLAITRSGTLLILMPIDILYWTRDVDTVFSSLSRRLSMLGQTRFDLVLSGALSEPARAAIQALGFGVYERFLTRG